MAQPGMKKQLQFPHRVRGAFGTFASTGNRQISFITTRFDERKIAGVRTARQVLPRKTLKVNELMQRDIDDDRVRTQIVQYLNPDVGLSNSRFFPPLVIGILPRNPTDTAVAPLRYPAPQLTDSGGFLHRQDEADDDMWYEERIYGGVFAVRIPLEEKNGSVDQTSYFHGSELLWDDEYTHLFAIDGQHRLLALQAVLGVLSEEERVRGYDEMALTEGELADLGFGSIPVCIVFPSLLHEGNAALDDKDTVTTVFRELFVDINKNAKVVSESRNILLNERDAIAVFTRNIVGDFVIEADLPDEAPVSETELPLYAFEFESDRGKEFQISDPRAVCSVGLLRTLIANILLLEDWDGPDTDNFRRELGVEEGDNELDPAVVGKQHGVLPNELDDQHFEPWQLSILERRFKDRWHEAFATMLRQLFPASELIEMLENKRHELIRDVKTHPLDRTPHHSLSYLLGTKVDQRQIDYASGLRDDEIKGVYEPLSCRKAQHAIKNNFFESLRNEKARPFSRLFFSQVGQVEIFNLVFRTIRRNCCAEDQAASELARAFVHDFNTTFEANSLKERLFDRNQKWNEPVIKSLNTFQYIRDHISGLLGLSMAFLPGKGELTPLLGGEEKWKKIRQSLFADGLQRVTDTLSQRLRNQVQRTTEMLLIESKERRKAEIDKKVSAMIEEISGRLREFLEANCGEERSFLDHM